MSEDRDFAMARLAAARTAAATCLDSIDIALQIFVDPDEDTNGETRTELLEAALDDAGLVSRAIEAVQGIWGDIDFSVGEMEEVDANEEDSDS